MRTLLIAFASSTLAAVALTPLVRGLSNRLGLHDATGGRKLHRRAVPRLGGLAVLAAICLPLLGLAVHGNRVSATLFDDRPMLLALAAGTGIIVVVGLLDDLAGAPVPVKLLGQVAAALAVWWAGVRIEVISIPLLSVASLGWLSLPATVAWIVLCINAINLVDGLDGLAGGVVVLAGGTLFAMSVAEGNTVAALMMACVVGATLGFLVFNLRPASIFLGDTGSMLLGFLLALVAVHSSQKSYALFSIVAAFIALGFPLFDLAMAMVRRFLTGRPVYWADQQHVHHILLRKGFSQRQSVAVLFTATAALGVLAFVFVFSDDRTSALAILAAAVAMGAAVRLLGYADIIRAGRRALLLRDVEEAAEARARVVQRLRRDLATADALEAVWNLLQHAAGDLGLELLEVRLLPGACPAGACSRWAWQRDSLGRNPEVNFETLREEEFPLGLARLDLGVMRAAWYEENALFGPHQVALARMVADSVAGAVAGLRERPGPPQPPQWPEAGGGRRAP